MFKLFIKLIASLFLILILAAVGLALFVDPNNYKSLIVTKIEEKINHPVAINGDISWRFWPTIGLGVEKVHIGQPNSQDTFADIEQINLYAQIIPLLSKQIEISKLSVETAKVYLPKKIELNIAHFDTALHLDVKNKLYEAQDGNMNMTISGLDGLTQAQPLDLNYKKLLANLATDEIIADDLQAKIFDGKLFVNATAQNFSKKPTLQGKIDIENIDPQQLAQAFGHKINGSTTMPLKKLNLNATFKNTDTGFIVKPFSAQLDNSKISGNLNVTSAKPFKGQGDIAIDSITVSGATLTQTTVHINADNNIIKFAPIKTNLPSGSLDGTVVLNIQKSTPRWDIDAKLNNMLLSNAKFTGHVNGQAKISANGFDGNTFLKTMNGNAAVNINDGTLNNIDLEYWLTVGESLLLSAKTITDLAINTAQTAIDKKNTHHTTFKEISGTFNIQQGIAHNNDLKVASDTILATGAGIIDLPKQQVNYAVNVGRQGSNTKIPLKISGNLTSPSIGIDPAGIQKLLLKGVTNGLADTMTGGVVPAIGAGEAIVNSLTGNNSSNNSNSKSDPIKDTLKGLFGQ